MEIGVNEHHPFFQGWTIWCSRIFLIVFRSIGKNRIQALHKQEALAWQCLRTTSHQMRYLQQLFRIDKNFSTFDQRVAFVKRVISFKLRETKSKFLQVSQSLGNIFILFVSFFCFSCTIAFLHVDGSIVNSQLLLCTFAVDTLYLDWAGTTAFGKDSAREKSLLSSSLTHTETWIKHKSENFCNDPNRP